MVESTKAVPTREIMDDDDPRWPPMSPKIKAAYRRMATDPHMFDGIEEGMWVALSGGTIVAAGYDHDAVIREAEEAGEPDPLIMPPMWDTFIG